jgi:hypothetical protein
MEKKKLMAAVSAVMNYIKSEEEMLCMQAVSAAPAAQAAVPPAALKVWGISGRQAMMEMRSLMQMRTFQGAQFR